MVKWTTRWGYPGVTCDYGQDVGNLHVIDYTLHLVWSVILPWPAIESPRHLRLSPADWSR